AEPAPAHVALAPPRAAPSPFCSSADSRDLPSFPTRRSSDLVPWESEVSPVADVSWSEVLSLLLRAANTRIPAIPRTAAAPTTIRSEEHTSELQSRENLVCRRLLEKTKTDHPGRPGASPRCAP